MAHMEPTAAFERDSSMLVSAVAVMELNSSCSIGKPYIYMYIYYGN